MLIFKFSFYLPAKKKVPTIFVYICIHLYLHLTLIMVKPSSYFFIGERSLMMYKNPMEIFVAHYPDLVYLSAFCLVIKYAHIWCALLVKSFPCKKKNGLFIIGWFLLVIIFLFWAWLSGLSQQQRAAKEEQMFGVICEAFLVNMLLYTCKDIEHCYGFRVGWLKEIGLL